MAVSDTHHMENELRNKYNGKGVIFCIYDLREPNKMAEEPK